MKLSMSMRLALAWQLIRGVCVRVTVTYDQEGGTELVLVPRRDWVRRNHV